MAFNIICIFSNTLIKIKHGLLQFISETDIQLNVICYFSKVSSGNSPEIVLIGLFVLPWASHLI